MARKIVLAMMLLSLTLSANAVIQNNLNMWQGWAVTAQNNAFVANATMLLYLPGAAQFAKQNTTYPVFQLTFTAPGTYHIDEFAVWQTNIGTPFAVGTPITGTFHPRIGGLTCQVGLNMCNITVPAGTTQTNPYIFYTDQFTDTTLDNQHNWVLAIYFDSVQPSGAAVAQGQGADAVTGALNPSSGNQVTGETSLPLGRDGSNRVFLFTGIEY